MTEESAKRFHLAVEPKDAGARVDAFLGNALREYSRSRLKGFIVDGAVVVNGARVKPSYRLREGDVIEGAVAPPTEPLPAPKSSRRP